MKRVVKVLTIVLIGGFSLSGVAMVKNSHLLKGPEVPVLVVECIEFVEGSWIRGGATGQINGVGKRIPMAFILDTETVTAKQLKSIKGPDCAFEVTLRNTTDIPVSMYEFAIEVVDFKRAPSMDSIMVRMPAPHFEINDLLITLDKPDGKSFPYLSNAVVRGEQGDFSDFGAYELTASGQGKFQVRLNAAVPGIYTFLAKVKVNCGDGEQSKYINISEETTWMFLNEE